MKIKRFLAPNMREALKAVRVEQGPDAVILSNRRVGEYIEIIAALDYDEALVNQALRASRQSRPTEDRDVVPDEIALEKDEAPEQAIAVSPNTGDTDVHNLLADADRGQAPAEHHRHDNTHITAIEIAEREPVQFDVMRDDISAVKLLLQEQLNTLRWQETAQRDPAAAQILRNLARLGIAADVAEQVYASIVRDGQRPTHAWRQPIGALSSALSSIEDRLLSEGGVAAFVGPTGVGKTTTIAKIASQYAVKHGARSIALVSMDSYRIGAQEQLRTFGRIINADVFDAASPLALSSLLPRLSDYRLVLIDTEGVSQRDTRLAATLDGLTNQPRPIDLYLTLAATVDEYLLDEIVRQYSQVSLAGCVLTKIDEASRLGAPISVMIRHDLPLTYLCDGQHVPDDLHIAQRKRLWLLNLALEYAMADQYMPDDASMASRYVSKEFAHG